MGRTLTTARYEVRTIADALTNSRTVARYSMARLAVAEAKSLKATYNEDYRVFEVREVYSTENTDVAQKAIQAAIDLSIVRSN